MLAPFRSLACLSAALLWVGCATSPARPSPPRPQDFRRPAPGPHEYKPVTLSNEVFPSGMRLVVREDHRARQTTLYVSYRAGATDVPDGKEGLAELAARLTWKARHGGAGTQTLEERLRAMSAEPRNTVTHDDTELTASLAPERLARAVALEAQRMADPLAHVTEEDFRQVRGQLIDEQWVAQQPMAKGPSREWLHQRLLAGHVYGRPVGGTPESLDRLTLEDARAFVKAHYTPAHAVLVVSGPVAIADAKFEVAKGFASLTGAGTGARIPPVPREPPSGPQDPPQGAPVVAERGQGRVPQLHFMLTLPGRYAGKYAEALVAQEALHQWLRANQSRHRDAFSNTFTGTFHELDGVTVLSCSVSLTRNVPEQELRKLAAGMLETFGETTDKMLEELEEEGFGPSTSFQFSQGIIPAFRRRNPRGVHAVLHRELFTQAHQVTAMNLARVIRATGRVDLGRLREEQVAQALSGDALADYLRRYVRASRVRTLLVLP